MKRIVILLLTIILPLGATALEVDVDELKSSEVRFTNYDGPVRNADPYREILAIGLILADGARKTGPNSLFRYHMKYSIFRATGEEEADRLSADIMSILVEARIDHIKNVRRIIAQYLKRTYGYTDSQARALALYVTCYNAVHRGDMPYFASRYKTRVVRRLNKRTAGISTNWREWPGTTAMVIPLTTDVKRGTIVDPFAIADRETSGSARADGNIAERKEMVDIRRERLKDERTAVADEKEKVRKEREALEKREKKDENDRRAIGKKKEELKKDRVTLERDKKETEKIEDPAERKKREEENLRRENELKEKERRLKEEEEKRRAEEEALKKEREKVRQGEQNAAKKEENLRRRENEVRTDEQEIRRDEGTAPAGGRKEEKTPVSPAPAPSDRKETTPAAREERVERREQEVAKKEEALNRREETMRQEAREENLFGRRMYYLKIMEYLEGGHYNNDLYMIDPATRKVLFKSEVTNICGNRYDIFSDGIVLITHRGNHTTGHRLTLVDRETLKPLRTGNDNVFWRSFIEIREGYIYAITWDNGDHYLARFDRDLKMTARSKEKVIENTFITFFENYIYINRADRQIMVLDRNTLEVVDVIKP